MKKFKLIFTVILIVAIFSGCSLGMSSNNADVTEIKASELPEKSAEWTEISRYTGDVDADGADENVILKTSAEKDETGEIFWGDSQEWILYVEDRTETFILLDEFIQIGSVYFEVLDYYMEDGGEPRINVMMSTGTGFKVESYLFNSKENLYECDVLYDTNAETKAGTNRRFSSIPEIK